MEKKVILALSLVLIIAMSIGGYILIKKPGKTDEIAYSMKEKVSTIKYFKGSQGSFSIYGIKSRTLMTGPIDNCGFVAIHNTDSMYPTIKEGDNICWERYNKKISIKEGDIIIFEFDDNKIVHRITRIDGNDLIITKGDNNEKEDYPITRDEILGIVRVIIPR